MKIETYLNAMLDAWYEYKTPEVILSNLDLTPTKRARQYLAFRARILKMDAEKDDVIEGQFKALARQAGVSAEKDKRIAELKAENQAMEYLLNEGENIGVE